MQLHDVQGIGIVGAGQMGAGIAMVSAKAGLDILVHDTNTGALDTALTHIHKGFDRQIQEGITSTQEADQAFQRIRTSQSLGDMVDVQLVIEAVPEQPDLKSRLFRELGMICKPDVILASNTSSISITKLGASAGRDELVAGMHFMNPVPVMRLVEITRGLRTARETLTFLSEMHTDGRVTQCSREGSYTWMYENNVLSFENVDDECDDRIRDTNGREYVLLDQ